jgi:hypothetical protein
MLAHSQGILPHHLAVLTPNDDLGGGAGHGLTLRLPPLLLKNSRREVYLR